VTVDLMGTHGTSTTRAKQIVAGGFLQGQGRAGVGVYLWRDCPLAKELAAAWAEQHDREFAADAETDPAVVYAKVSVSENEFLDLEEPDLKDMLQTLAVEKGLTKDHTEEQARGLISMFISQYETVSESPVKALQVRLAPPESRHLTCYSIRLFGAPLCYVVLDRGCIRADRWEAAS
jgi:hypothetical protein